MSGKTRKTVICLIGLGALCAMFRAPFFGTLTMALPPGFSGFRVVYDASLIILACLFLVFSLYRERGRRIKKQQNESVISYAAAGALAIAGVLVINAGRLLEASFEGLYAVGIVVLCIGFSALVAGWIRVLMTLAREDISVMVMAAFVVSHAFGIFDMLPREWASMLSVIYPLLAAAMLCMLRNDMLMMHASQESGSLLNDAYLRKIQVFNLVLIFAELLCGAFLRGRWAHGGIGYSPHPNTIISYAVSFAIGLLFLAIAKRSRTTTECTLIIGNLGLIGFVVSTILFSLSSSLPFPPFVTGLYSALLVYLMALVSLWCMDGTHDSLFGAGTFLGIYGLASGITSSIIPAILVYLQIDPGESLVPIGGAAGLIISFAMCVVLFAMVVVHRKLFLEKIEQTDDEGQSESQTTAVEQPLSSDERHELAVNIIAEKYGLTDRERETASLMARGYTAKRVAEELTVAVNTVKGYSKSIYTKMGIHRKDELIEQVKEVKEQL